MLHKYSAYKARRAFWKIRGIWHSEGEMEQFKKHGTILMDVTKPVRKAVQERYLEQARNGILDVAEGRSTDSLKQFIRGLRFFWAEGNDNYIRAEYSQEVKEYDLYAQ